MQTPETPGVPLHRRSNEVEVKASALEASETRVPSEITRCSDFENAEQALVRVQQRLRIQQNSSLLPMRTPPELLGVIFKLVQDDEKLEAYGADRRRFFPIRPDKFAYGWIAVTHVCHYWRQVAISYPDLWTSIRVEHALENGGRGEAEWYTANAGNMPLSVYIHITVTRMPRILHETFSMMSRICELRLTGTVSTQSDLDLLLKQSAPNLEALAFHVQSKTTSSWERPTHLPILFLDHHPRLTSLSLRGYNRFEGNSFRTVKRLHLSKQSYTTLKSFWRFSELLDGMPTLEELTLSWIEFREIDTIIDLYDEVPLPNLRKLSFVGIDPTGIHTILDCLVLPHDLAILCDMRGQRLQDVYEIIHRHQVYFRDACRMDLEFTSLSTLNIIISSATSVTRFANCCFRSKISITEFLITIRTVGSLQDVWIRQPDMYTAEDDTEEEIDPFYLAHTLQPLKNLVLDFPPERTQEVFDQCLSYPYYIDDIHLGLRVLLEYPWFDDHSWKGVLGQIHVYTTDEGDLSPSSREQLQYFKNAISEEVVCGSHVDFLPIERFPKMSLPPIPISKGDAGWDWPKWGQDV